MLGNRETPHDRLCYGAPYCLRSVSVELKALVSLLVRKMISTIKSRSGCLTGNDLPGSVWGQAASGSTGQAGKTHPSPTWQPSQEEMEGGHSPPDRGVSLSHHYSVCGGAPPWSSPQGTWDADSLVRCRTGGARSSPLPGYALQLGSGIGSVRTAVQAKGGREEWSRRRIPAVQP